MRLRRATVVARELAAKDCARIERIGNDVTVFLRRDRMPFTESYLAGVIAVFAPAGLLVREAALISVLTPVLGGPDAVILAVAARIWHTALELVSGALVLAIPVPRP